VCPHNKLGDGRILGLHTGAAGVRTSFSMWQKAKVIEKYYELESNPLVRCPHTETAKWAFGKSWHARKSYLTKWLKKTETIRDLTSRSGRAAALKRDPTALDRNVKYADQEDELYIRFLHRRTVLGYPCNAYWLCMEMGRILQEAPPADFDSNKTVSIGWAVRFCHRFRITTQAKNNCKAHDQRDRKKGHQEVPQVPELHAPGIRAAEGSKVRSVWPATHVPR
jgi:hypothetical protein